MYETGKKLACQLIDSKIWYIGKVKKVIQPFVWIDIDCNGGEAVFNLHADNIHLVTQLRGNRHA